jgi:hypothetical protein
MGTKEDVQKLFDALCEPNKYNGTGINLDRNSIQPIEGTAFPLWEAKGETDKVPELIVKPEYFENNVFDNLYADFPALSIHICIFYDDGNGIHFDGGNGHGSGCGIIEVDDEFDCGIENILYNLWKLGDMPKTITKNEAMCFEAVRKGKGLFHFPDEFKTTEICLEAVKVRSWELKHVPEQLKTMELCLEAVKVNGWTLKYVPEKLKTTELCLIAVIQKKDDFIDLEDIFDSDCNKTNKTVFSFIPDELKTTEFYLEVVKMNGQMLEHVPQELKTAEMCLNAVKQKGSALEYVPIEFKTVELCHEAINQNSWALKYVPEEFKTAELCNKAVKQYGWELEYVPDKFKTTEMCFEAVKQYGRVFEYVPEEFKTTEICLLAVKRTSEMLKFVPD